MRPLCVASITPASPLTAPLTGSPAASPPQASPAARALQRCAEHNQQPSVPRLEAWRERERPSGVGDVSRSHLGLVLRGLLLGGAACDAERSGSRRDQLWLEKKSRPRPSKRGSGCVERRGCVANSTAPEPLFWLVAHLRHHSSPLLDQLPDEKLPETAWQ